MPSSPRPPTTPVVRRTGSTHRPGPWLALGLVALGVVAAAATSGVAAVLISVGMLGLVAALVQVVGPRAVRGRSRKVGLGMLGVSLALVVAGSAVAGPAAPPGTGPGGAGTSAVSSPAATRPPSPTPTPTSSADDAAAGPDAGPAPDGPTTDAPAAEAPAAGDGVSATPDGDALATLALLEVKGRAPKTGYDRDAFAYRALDLDRNGCDTRNDVLARDLVHETFRAGTGGCVVETGTLADPYSGSVVLFQRGTATSHDVQIDHVVALSDAWQKGAQQWDAATRQRFGNDPLNLLAVDGPLNAQKGDSDAATWLPPNKGFRCEYVARQIAVKHAYRLWVTAAERDAMARVLGGCPGQPLPDGTGPRPQTVPAPAPGPAPAPPAAPAPVPDPGPVSYASCAAVRAAGAAPIHAGDPGYAARLDGDGDGVGCE